MKALLLRDFRAYRYFFLLLLIVMLLYAYLIYQTGSADGLLGLILVFIPSIAVVILFLGDNALISLSASLPVTRTQLVVGKYVSTYIFGGMLVISSIVITWFLSYTINILKLDLHQLLTLPGLLVAILPITVIVSVSYPCLFKFGFNLGAKILLIIFTVIYCLGLVVAERFVLSWLNVQRRGIFAAAMAIMYKGEDRFGAFGFYFTLIAIVIMLFFGSLWLSVNWMKRKDII